MVTDPIIFLDIDGVLNYQDVYKRENPMRRFYNDCLKLGIIDIKENSNLINKLYIDEDNLTNLLWVASSTNAKIVVISSWATTNDWPIIEQYLIKRGLPVIDRITHNKRVYFIKKYIFLNNISNFVILDDEYFKGYNLYQEHFIHCNFYNAGFDYDMAKEAIYKLKRN